MRATEHFRQRVRERIGPGHDADLIAEHIIRAIENDRKDLVQYLGRVKRDGLRAFRFRVEDRYFVALVNTDTRRCVTVVPPEGKIGRHADIGPPIRLETGS